ncbi:MAG: NAD-dependent epimerase/dehydratase family protein, partial [Planctomycetota bacterium]|nr:NAD-dependent epimerase/dehydratase family protein [Planctomycetota bacterium]
MSRVLVTGGAGFIGSHLVEHLLDQGHSILVVDDLSTGRAHQVPTHPQVELIESTVDQWLTDGPSEQFCEAYHMAAAVGVRKVVEDPFGTIMNNVVETAALLRFLAKASTPTLLASTSEVYGVGQGRPFRETDDSVYGPTTVARWSYAHSKAVDEHLAFALEQELPSVVVRFFNTVGPRQRGDWGMVLPRFVKAALANAPIQVHGDGKQKRCFADVRDIVDSLPKLLRSSDARGLPVNLGHDEPITILALAELVRDVLNSKS